MHTAIGKRSTRKRTHCMALSGSYADATEVSSPEPERRPKQKEQEMWSSSEDRVMLDVLAKQNAAAGNDMEAYTKFPWTMIGNKLRRTPAGES